jgi:hypothetical protein
MFQCINKSTEIIDILSFYIVRQKAVVVTDALAAGYTSVLAANQQQSGGNNTGEVTEWRALHHLLVSCTIHLSV